MSEDKKQLQQWLDSLLVDGTPSFQECVDYLGDYFPLLKEFEKTEQDPIWHAEGNVAVHTEMVLQELYELLPTVSSIFGEPLTGVERQSLILGALLHDIAKPITTYTCITTSRIKSPHHEEKGKHYLVFNFLKLMGDAYITENVYITVLELVGQHQKPKLLVIKDEPNYKFHRLMNDVDYKLLYLLEIADIKGRTCDDKDIQLMYLEEFKDKCEQLIETTLTFDHEHAPTGFQIKRGLYDLAHKRVKNISEFKSKYYENPKAYLTLMCGISGSGKSTYIANRIKDNPHHIVISLDDIRAELSYREDQSRNGEVIQLAKQRLKQALAKGSNVIWDATNTRKEFRDVLVQIGLDYNAFVAIQVILNTENNVRKQNVNRKHTVPEYVISKQIKQFQFPTRSEAHLVHYQLL